MARECMLSTVDNPYNPYTNFEDWLRYDMDKGYNSCAYLARIAMTSDSLSENENNLEIERSIDEIIANDFMNLFIKVFKDEKDLPS